MSRRTSWHLPPSAASPLSPPTPLPTELWATIFSFVVAHPADDLLYPISGLLRCALTCRAWAMIALPMLYRTHGFGVFMPAPATRDKRSTLFPTSRSSDTTRATRRQLQLWRTLLLSCFTARDPSKGRFGVYADAALFPYIRYVRRLDARTLVGVLLGIVRSRRGEGEGELGRMAGEEFFDGALGAFEISGEKRGGRMIVGGPEWRVQSPVPGKDVRIFVADTALMILDFLYAHVRHLEAFTIPELGELKVHRPIDMGHPVSLLSTLIALNALVISSGWMLSAGLGRAIAALRPTLTPRSPPFSLTILNWRHKTHYSGQCIPSGEENDNPEHFRYTIRSTHDFFAALNPDSVTSMDIDFAARLATDLLGLGGLVVGQARSLRALRIAGLRAEHSRLITVFTQMATEGWAPVALRLDDLCLSYASQADWRSFRPACSGLRSLELARWEGMWRFAEDVVDELVPLKVCVMVWDCRFGCDEMFLLYTLPRLARSLTTLKLVDTDHNLWSPVRPAGRMVYEEDAGEWGMLESLVGLRTLVLTGDVAGWLIGDRLEAVLDALGGTLVTCDLSLSAKEIDGTKLQAFTRCRNLERLMLREWSWDGDGTRDISPPGRSRKMTVEVVKDFLDRCSYVSVGSDRVQLVLQDLGIAGGLLEVAGEKNWGELKEWAGAQGTIFNWNAAEMPLTP